MPKLSPISIGPVRIETPVILAPLTGVTDRPFRKMVKRFGAGLTVTEMIASQAMIRETRQSLQKAAWDPIEDPVSMQLAGAQPASCSDTGSSLGSHAAFCSDWRVSRIIAWLAIISLTVSPAP